MPEKMEARGGNANRILPETWPQTAKDETQVLK
jgi:hypothetical protein